MKIYQKDRYHTWRWRHMVGPLVDKDGQDRKVLDLGCNAGWYMTKLEGLGYRTKGVEYDPMYISQAPDNLDIKQQDINYFDPGCYHTTLMLCVHYHQSPEQAQALFLKLAESSCKMIVMGRQNVDGQVRSSARWQNVHRNLMDGWREVDKRVNKNFYTLLLESKYLKEFDVETLFRATRRYTSKIKGYVDFAPQFSEFIRKTIINPEWDPQNSPFVSYLKKRRLTYPLGHCWVYKRMLEEIKANGLSAPLSVRNERIQDGYHRLIILRELGIKRVVCMVRGAPKHGRIGE